MRSQKVYKNNRYSNKIKQKKGEKIHLAFLRSSTPRKYTLLIGQGCVLPYLVLPLKHQSDLHRRVSVCLPSAHSLSPPFPFHILESSLTFLLLNPCLFFFPFLAALAEVSVWLGTSSSSSSSSSMLSSC